MTDTKTLRELLAADPLGQVRWTNDYPDSDGAEGWALVDDEKFPRPYGVLWCDRGNAPVAAHRELIAALHNAAPALLDEVDALRASLKASEARAEGLAAAVEKAYAHLDEGHQHSAFAVLKAALSAPAPEAAQTPAPAATPDAAAFVGFGAVMQVVPDATPDSRDPSTLDAIITSTQKFSRANALRAATSRVTGVHTGPLAADADPEAHAFVKALEARIATERKEAAEAEHARCVAIVHAVADSHRDADGKRTVEGYGALDAWDRLNMAKPGTAPVAYRRQERGTPEARVADAVRTALEGVKADVGRIKYATDISGRVTANQVWLADVNDVLDRAAGEHVAFVPGGYRRAQPPTACGRCDYAAGPAQCGCATYVPIDSSDGAGVPVGRAGSTPANEGGPGWQSAGSIPASSDPLAEAVARVEALPRRCGGPGGAHRWLGEKPGKEPRSCVDCGHVAALGEDHTYPFVGHAGGRS